MKQDEEFSWVHKLKKIIRTVDGDTIVADVDLGHNVILTKQVIRFYGIDTPEKRGHNKQIGKAVGEFVERYIAKLTRQYDGVIWFKSEAKKDSFGRMIGSIYFGDQVRSLNEQLLQYGFARVYKSGIPFNKKHILQEIKNLEIWLTEN